MLQVPPTVIKYSQDCQLGRSLSTISQRTQILRSRAHSTKEISRQAPYKPRRKLSINIHKHKISSKTYLLTYEQVSKVASLINLSTDLLSCHKS